MGNTEGQINKEQEMIYVENCGTPALQPKKMPLQEVMDNSSSVIDLKTRNTPQKIKPRRASKILDDECPGSIKNEQLWNEKDNIESKETSSRPVTKRASNIQVTDLQANEENSLKRQSSIDIKPKRFRSSQFNPNC